MIFETAWTRLLSQIYGSTVYATSTVLAAFMAGLALGSYFFGKRADLQKNPIKLYAFLELGIGLYALWSPMLFGTLNPIYLLAYRYLISVRMLYFVVLFSVTFLFLLVPTILMGGTLPVLSKFFVGHKDILGRKIGGLYAVNTFGAMTGCFATGFFLIGNVGIKETIYLAALINISIFAILYAGRSYISLPNRSEVLAESRAESPVGKLKVDKRVVLILSAFSLSGFSALGYEVLWSRGLIFYLGNSTWAFTAMLTVILGCIAIGSMLIRKACDSRPNLSELFGWMEIGIGIAAGFTILLLGSVLNQPAVFHFITGLSRHWLTKMGGIFLIAAAVMAVPALLMGATFPLVNRICVQNLQSLGGKVGVVYSVNTVGAILGSLLAGFVLIPLVGILRGILILAVINVLVGWSVLALDRYRAFRLRFACSAFLLLFAAAVFIAFPTTLKFRSEFADPTDRLLFYHEDAVATTQVFQKSNGDKLMSIDGHTIGGTEHNIDRKQKLLAHLPLLLSKNPKSVFVVGLGTGITLGSIQLYPELERIGAAEIVPGVIEGARLFANENRQALSQPKVSIILGDGVNHLRNSSQMYDVISSDEKLNPEYVGNTVGLAEDYYKICIQRLNENGIMCQWIPFDMPENEYRAIVRTFTSAFPHTSLWYFGWTESILVGTKKKLSIDFMTLADRMDQPPIRDELAKLDLDNPYGLLSNFICDERELREYAKGAPINSWNRPYIEFHAPMDFALRPQQGVVARRLQTLIPMQQDILDYAYNLGSDDGEIAMTREQMRAYREAWRGTFVKAIAAAGETPSIAKGLENPSDSQPLLARAKSLLESGDASGAITVLSDALNQSSESAELLVALGYACLAADRIDEAVHFLKRAAAMDPDRPEVQEYLGVAYQKMGNLEDAAASYRKLIEAQPNNPAPHYNLGVIYHQMGLYQEEFSAYQQALQLKPDYGLALYNLGIWYGNYERYDEAIQVFERLVTVEPDNAQARYYLGVAYAKKDRLDEARLQFNKALEIEPQFLGARDGLKLLDDMQRRAPTAKSASRFRVSHILVRTQSEAEEILKLLQKGRAFAEMARQKSIDPSATRGGDLGFFAKGDFFPEFEEAVLRLKVGEMSGVVKTRLGYHIILRTQ